jgi:hypothetical protein
MIRAASAMSFRTPSPLAAFALASCASAFYACSLVFPADTLQCKIDQDCADRGFAGMQCAEGLCIADASGGGGAGGQGGEGGQGGAGGEGGTVGPWDCQATVEWALEDQATPATVSLAVLTLIGQEPFPGLTFQICPQFDPDCQNPLGSGTSDANGTLSLEVHVGFRGHFFAAPPPTFPEMAPTLLYQFPPPVADMGEANGNINITTLAEMQVIANIAQETIVPGNGHIFFTALDCNGDRAEGVTLTIDGAGDDTFTVYVSESGNPSAMLPSTTSRGEGAIVNVPPDFITVTGTHDDYGDVFQSTVQIQADSITGVPIVASPL